MCYSAMIEQDVKFLADLFGSSPVQSSWSEFEAMRVQEDSVVPPLAARVFPGYFAPVLHTEEHRVVIRLMRYSIDPPDFIKDGKRYTTYNARFDNLESPFWGESFRRHHGLVVMRGFFEWVAAKQLVKAGRVTMEEIKQEFERQKTVRRMKMKQAGRPYKPTRTELTEAGFRKVAISFKPDPEQELFVPTLFSKQTGPSGVSRYGFAIVTDDPPAEVQAAGHDRCPIFLLRDAADHWLSQPPTSSVDELKGVLKRRVELPIRHELDRSG
jgi:putative SOS response-associated peptidase YedK